MNVLYFASGLMIGVSVAANLLTSDNSWGILFIPAILAGSIAAAWEYNTR